MSIWHVTGGRPLRGSIKVQGSKNAVLPVIAASLLCPNETELLNCPALSDVDAAVDILRYLGCAAEHRSDVLRIDAAAPGRCDIPRELMHRMRSSVIFLGPLLARFGEARLSVPGGCELGPRPIDLHLQAMRLLGAEIREEGDAIECRSAALRGAEIPFPFPSVGATENAMIAACAAQGSTVIYNAAREPEIETLQEYLRLLGAEISGAGSPVIRIEGFSPRPRAGLRVPSDRIAAATYLCCAACAGGEIVLTGTEPKKLVPVLNALESMGCALGTGFDTIHIGAPERVASPGAVVTRPYPGFPTDAAPLLMAACLKGRGPAMFIENIFIGRYRHAEEMRRFGADILLRGPMALVNGVPVLHGAAVTSPDLRGGAALVAAALGAEGESVVSDAGHILRGYDGLDVCLRALGADVWRE
ncbi:MAG: UDP-N-acetylglucosamine 1-carboxyvinyltransferase [Oscillospiraceae bacterium]|nr:UDP-N-acetylglucosamine 1-carboxyvinyltransferase [Oscillospiraceae bacterium]